MAENTFENVAIIGSGTMGHGIAQVCAMAGMEVRMFDLSDAALQRGLDKVHANLDKGVDRGKVASELRDETLIRLAGTTDLETAVDGANLVIEAVPEKLELKQKILDGGVHGPAAVVSRWELLTKTIVLHEAKKQMMSDLMRAARCARASARAVVMWTAEGPRGGGPEDVRPQ